jgi:hypothetical protein
MSDLFFLKENFRQKGENRVSVTFFWQIFAKEKTAYIG